LRYEQDLAELEQRRREFEAEKAEWETRIENDKRVKKKKTNTLFS